MPVVADLGPFAPTDTVTHRFATANPWGGLDWWGGVALLVRPDGQASEDGAAYALDSPADGLHEVAFNLAVAAEVGGPLAPGRYFIALYGDAIQQEPVQNVLVATFTVTP